MCSLELRIVAVGSAIAQRAVAMSRLLPSKARVKLSGPAQAKSDRIREQKMKFPFENFGKPVITPVLSQIR